MKHFSLLLWAGSCLLPAGPALAQATNPIVTSWLLNTNSAKGFNNQTANVTSVKYSATSVYIGCPSIPSYSLNYVAPSSGNGTAATNSWFPQPTAGPTAQTFTAYSYRLPLTPTANAGAPVALPGANIGVWINGTNIFPAKDASSYNNQGIWFTDAVVNEGVGFDVCNGHPNLTNVYHTHVNPDCLYDRRDSTRHSPIIGYAMDGYPIYGAYGYKNADGTGGLKSMKSSYTLRSITQRHSLSDGVALSAANYGPDVSASAPLGKYVEDNIYVAGRGDLDARNGRWCVTPEYPSGTYAYFATINSLYEGAYPYTIASSYYGTVPYNNNNSATATIGETVTTYTPASSLTVSTSKVLAGGSFSDVTVTGTGNLLLVQPLTVTGTLSVATGGALNTGTLDPNVQTISGTGSFTLNSGARLTIDHAAGIAGSGSTGAVQVSGTRSFDANAEYVYAGAAAQTTGTGLPATVKTVTVNNSAGVTLSQGTTLTGVLTLQSGALSTGTGSATQPLTIASGGTLTAGTNLVSGDGSVTLASGATLKTANTAGVRASTSSGSVQGNGTKTFNSGATYEFNGTAAQVTSTNLPTTVAGLTINNASGVTLSQSTTVSSALTLTAGTLSTASGKNLTLANGSIATAGTNLINGGGNFTLANGATLKTAHTAGLASTGATGTVQNTGSSRSFGIGASYEYNGTATQITGTGLPATVSTLTINNSAGVTLTSSTAPSTALTMTSGVLTTGSNKVTLGSTATITETEASYVAGTVETTRAVSTAGSANDFGGLGLTLTPSGSTLPGSTLAQRVTGTALTSTSGGVGIKRYFTITPTTNAGLDVTLRMGYRDAELNGLPEASLTLYKSPSALTGPWAPQTAGTVTRDAANNWVAVTGISDFSVWTLGSSTTTPLPVELTSFDVARAGSTAVLRWATASEKNNDHFEVEVGTDGRTFAALGRVAGHGSTSQAHTYGFVDEQLTSRRAAVVYYRLRQVDTDGTFTHSPVRAVHLNGAGSDALTLAALPNPLNPGDELGLAIVAPAAGVATLTLRDALGRVQLTQTMEVTAGPNRLTLQPAATAELRPGLYSVQLQLNGQQATAKLLRNYN